MQGAPAVAIVCSLAVCASRSPSRVFVPNGRIGIPSAHLHFLHGVPSDRNIHAAATIIKTITGGTATPCTTNVAQSAAPTSKTWSWRRHLGGFGPLGPSSLLLFISISFRKACCLAVSEPREWLTRIYGPPSPSSLAKRRDWGLKVAIRASSRYLPGGGWIWKFPRAAAHSGMGSV